jgi:hypothetical protein
VAFVLLSNLRRSFVSVTERIVNGVDKRRRIARHESVLIEPERSCNAICDLSGFFTHGLTSGLLRQARNRRDIDHATFR